METQLLAGFSFWQLPASIKFKSTDYYCRPFYLFINTPQSTPPLCFGSYLLSSHCSSWGSRSKMRPRTRPRTRIRSCRCSGRWWSAASGRRLSLCSGQRECCSSCGSWRAWSGGWVPQTAESASPRSSGRGVGHHLLHDQVTKRKPGG